MLALLSNDGRDFLAMSQRALDSLAKDQIRSLSKYCEILPMSIPTIETVGGGSVRCMICEIFVSPK